MSLSNTTADALATAICSALNVTDTAAINRWKAICETLYSHLKSDIAIVLPTSSVVTVGGPATQTGPQAPVTMNPQ